MNANSHKSVNERPARDEIGPLDDWLDDALEQSFPASDPVASFRGDRSPPSNEASGDTGEDA